MRTKPVTLGPRHTHRARLSFARLGGLLKPSEAHGAIFAPFGAPVKGASSFHVQDNPKPSLFDLALTLHLYKRILICPPFFGFPPDFPPMLLAGGSLPAPTVRPLRAVAQSSPGVHATVSPLATKALGPPRKRVPPPSSRRSGGPISDHTTAPR